MTQLINPYRYGLFTLLYEGESPEGEMLIDYADKEWRGEKHSGEIPVAVIKEVDAHGEAAFKAIVSVANQITKNRSEFYRLFNDISSYNGLAKHFSNKVSAALQVLRYKYSGDIKDLELALKFLQQSVQYYTLLTNITQSTYLYANSMQTQQRKIPMRGVNGTYRHWKEMLPVFETELNTFKRKIDSLKNNSGKVVTAAKPFRNADVRTTDSAEAYFTVEKEGRVFADTNLIIKSYAKELHGLQGVNFGYKQQLTESASFTFVSEKPVKVLVGFFKPQKAAFTKEVIYLKEPELETNASADDYGQAEIKISNAIAIEGMPPVDIHTYSFKAGKNILKLEKGLCLILGFVDGNTIVPVYNAGLMSDNKNKNLDWLFE